MGSSLIENLHGSRIAGKDTIADIEVTILCRVEVADSALSRTHLNPGVTRRGSNLNIPLVVDAPRGTLHIIVVLHRLEVLEESGLGASGLGPEDLVIGTRAAGGGEGHIVTVADILIVSDGGRGGEVRGDDNRHRSGLSTLVIIGHHGIGGGFGECRGGEGIVITLLQRGARCGRTCIPFVGRERRGSRERGGVATANRGLGSQLKRADVADGLNHLVGIEHVIRAVAEGLVAVLNDIAAGGIAGAGTDFIISNIIP